MEVSRSTIDFPDPSSGRRLRQYLPVAIMMTGAVMLMPALTVFALATGGITSNFWLLLGAAILTSVAVGYCARSAWSRRQASKDVLFADLMLWRWLQRWWSERRLSGVMARMGIDEQTMNGDHALALDFDALRDLADALEARDPYTHGHSRRVARFSAMIAKNLDLEEGEIAKIRTAAAVHDIGKLEVPLEVLNKPGSLTDEEFEVIKSHAPLGAKLVDKLGDPELTEIVVHHHERMDGTGYPERIGGEKIPLGARIIAVADTFDALTSTRAYRPASRQAEALRILHTEAGTQLDPDAVKAFERSYDGSLRAWLAWPLLATLPHRLWDQTAAVQAQAAGGSLAAHGAAVAGATVIAVGGAASTGSEDAGAKRAQRPAITAVAAPAGMPASEIKERAEIAAAGGTPASVVAERLEEAGIRSRGAKDEGGGGGGGAGSRGGGDGADGGGPAASEGDGSTAPGQGGSGERIGSDSGGGTPESPGNSGGGKGKGKGKPENPGNPDKGKGKPANPGNPGQGNGNPAKSEKPAKSTKTPKTPKPKPPKATEPPKAPKPPKSKPPKPPKPPKAKSPVPKLPDAPKVPGGNRGGSAFA